MSTHEETLERLRERAAAEELPVEPELELDEPGPIEDEPAEEGKKASTREYVVFINTGNAWREEARVVASTASAAMESLGEKLNDSTQYAACPVRNWTVGAPEIKTTTSVKIALL